MSIDISGIWHGTLASDGLTYMQGLEGGGWGGPPENHRVSLWISAQSPYKNFGYGQVVSHISGQMDGYTFHSSAFNGFIDDKGLVKLTFYVPTASVDWTLNARLTLRGTRGDISGTWTRMSWSEGLALHAVGTLSVRKFVPRIFVHTSLSYRRLEI
jgi:hypothetical protein